MTRETYVKYVKSSPRMVSSRPHGRVEAVVAGMYMEFTFTGIEAMMNRIVDDTRLEAISDQEDLLQSVVNAQLKEFHN